MLNVTFNGFITKGKARIYYDCWIGSDIGFTSIRDWYGIRVRPAIGLAFPQKNNHKVVPDVGSVFQFQYGRRIPNISL